MKVTYDKKSNTAYIRLADKIRGGGVTKTVPISENQIYLDFTKNRLVGIEVLGATQHLPPELLKKAEILGKPEC